MDKIEPYWNEDHTKYAILISTGWSGWSIMNFPEFAYDSRIVSYVIEHLKDENWQRSFRYKEDGTLKNMKEEKEGKERKEFEAYLASIGYNHVTMSPAGDLKVLWIDAGRRWRIIDGGECQEYILFEDEIDWMSFGNAPDEKKVVYLHNSYSAIEGGHENHSIEIYATYEDAKAVLDENAKRFEETGRTVKWVGKDDFQCASIGYVYRQWVEPIDLKTHNGKEVVNV